MYETFFGLRQRPFPAVPCPNSYYPAEAIEHSRNVLIRTIDRAEGMGLIVGPAGTGKSLLCQILAEHFRNQFHVVGLSSARLCTRRALLQNILFELKLPFREMEEGELRLSLMDHLEPKDNHSEGMLLLIDEAHTLPLRLLEEVRLITNLVRNGRPRVRLVLAGNGQLEEKLANPKLESFNQRIAARCYLHAFTHHETVQYIQRVLALAGGYADAIFGDDAYRAVMHATDGVPRLINQLCDHVLMLAFAGGTRRIDSRGIEEAWADLQRLPAPWSAADIQPGENTIEFGSLDRDTELEPEEDESFTQLLQQQVTNIRRPDLQNVIDEFETFPDDLPNQTPMHEYGQNDVPNIVVEFNDDIRSAAVAPAAIGSQAWADDLFGGPFADEEVVIDRYSTWDAMTKPRLPRVSNWESQEMAAALSAQFETLPISSAEEALAASVVAVGQFTHDALQQFQSFSDTGALETGAMAELSETDTPELLPAEMRETNVHWWQAAEVSQPVESKSNAPLVTHPGNSVFSQLTNDDRDMIIVEDDNELRIPAAPSRPRASRQEYASLFGQLRRS